MSGFKVKCYEPEEELRENSQDLNCACVKFTGAIWTPMVLTQFLLGIIASWVKYDSLKLAEDADDHGEFFLCRAPSASAHSWYQISCVWVGLGYFRAEPGWMDKSNKISHLPSLIAALVLRYPPPPPASLSGRLPRWWLWLTSSDPSRVEGIESPDRGGGTPPVKMTRSAGACGDRFSSSPETTQ